METDLLIIGGGINGTGIAADAARRGLSVVLCEQEDLAFATSSYSSKLIHGGLRYLEQYDFKLVREALKEREVLLKKAPFLIHPLEFILPHEKHLRPTWMIRIGLFLYDHLSKRNTIPRSRLLKLKSSVTGKPLKKSFKKAFSYYDCQTDDSRLTILNAIDARDFGAKILTRTRFISANRYKTYWQAKLHKQLNNESLSIKAKIIINATGPWAAQCHQQILPNTTPPHLTLVKGSHIIVPQLYPEKHAYILQHTDNRVVFVMPFQNKFSLIGTTDIKFPADTHQDSIHQAKISESEVQYLCDIVNHYFTQPINPKDIVWDFSGVRGLYGKDSKNPTKVSREFHFDLNTDQQQAPLLSILGGKITTFRILAEQAIDLLKPFFLENLRKSKTATETLPGGDIPNKDFNTFFAQLVQAYPWLPEKIITRYAKSYGNLTYLLLNDINTIEDLGRDFGAGLYEREIIYLIQNEWAQTVDDIIWRRTKLGLLLTAEQLEKLKAYFNDL